MDNFRPEHKLLVTVAMVVTLAMLLKVHLQRLFLFLKSTWVLVLWHQNNECNSKLAVSVFCVVVQLGVVVDVRVHSRRGSITTRARAR